MLYLLSINNSDTSTAWNLDMMNIRHRRKIYSISKGTEVTVDMSFATKMKSSYTPTPKTKILVNKKQVQTST